LTTKGKEKNVSLTIKGGVQQDGRRGKTPLDGQKSEKKKTDFWERRQISPVIERFITCKGGVRTQKERERISDWIKKRKKYSLDKNGNNCGQEKTWGGGGKGKFLGRRERQP